MKGTVTTFKLIFYVTTTINLANIAITSKTTAELFSYSEHRRLTRSAPTNATITKPLSNEDQNSSRPELPSGSEDENLIRTEESPDIPEPVTITNNGSIATNQASVLDSLRSDTKQPEHLNDSEPIVIGINNVTPIDESMIDDGINNRSNSEVLASALGEIKQMLTNLNLSHFHNDGFQQSANNSFLVRLLNKVSDIQRSLDECKEDSQQKINLVMENFSTMKLLLSSHEDRIQDNTRQILSSRTQFADTLKDVVAESKCVAKIYYHENETVHADNKVSNVDNDVILNDQELMNSTLFTLTEDVDRLRERLSLNDAKFTNILEEVDSAVKNLSCKCDRSNATIQRTIVSSDPFMSTLMKTAIETLKKDIQVLKLKEHSLSAEVEKLRGEVSAGRSGTQLLNANSNEVGTTPSDLAAKVARIESELEAMSGLKEEVEYLRKAVEQQKNSSSKALCVYPYKYSNDGCFHINTDERLSWIAARGRCQELQGDLAAPNNFEVFRQFLVSQRLSRSYSFWVSGNDQEAEGDWRWIDGRPVSRNVWASGQPNQLKAANCMEIKPGFKFVAADEDCREQKYFICQQRVS